MFYQDSPTDRAKSAIKIAIVFIAMLALLALFGAVALYLLWPLGPAAVTRPLDFGAAFGWSGTVVVAVALVRMAWAAKVVE